VPAEQVHLAGLKTGQYDRLTVTDTGTGMDRATLGRALEPFFTTEPQDTGSGHGLWSRVADGQVFRRAARGALAIESAPGQGTTSTRWLPAADARTEAAGCAPALRSSLV
jgi:signal transduction histidine kinase